MGRFGLALAMVAVWVGIGGAAHGGGPPQQVLARMGADGQLELWQQVFEYVKEAQTRTKTVFEEQAVEVEKEVDGKKVKETVTKKVPKQVFETYYIQTLVHRLVAMQPDNESTKFFETDGRPANAATVAQRLSKPTLVLQVWDVKPPPDYYAGVFKPGTLFIAIQPHAAPAPAPAAPGAAARLSAPTTGRTAVSLWQNFANRISLLDAAHTVLVSLQEEPRTAIPPDVKFPNAPPPQLVFGSRDGQGNLSLRTMSESSCITIAQIEVLDSKGNPAAKDIQLKIAHRHSTVVQVPEKYVKVFLAGGRRLEQRELPQLLPRESTVVASQDGQPVDPFWLQNIKPTILVVVPPRGSLGDQGVATVAMPAPTVAEPVHPQQPPAPPPATESPAPKKAPAVPVPREAPAPQPAKPPAPTAESGPQSRAQTNQDFQNGDDKFNAAIADLNEKIRRDPGNPEPHYAMAFVQHKAGRVNDAWTSVRAARGLEKKRPIADWGRLMERYQGPSRIWLEDARRKPFDELLTPEPLGTEPLPGEVVPPPNVEPTPAPKA